MQHKENATSEHEARRNFALCAINGAIFQYLDMGVDAIRVDTVKHVNLHQHGCFGSCGQASGCSR